jgi:hypothetical protein
MCHASVFPAISTLTGGVLALGFGLASAACSAAPKVEWLMARALRLA